MTKPKKVLMDDKAANRIKDAQLKKPKENKSDQFPNRARDAADRNKQ